MLQKLEDAQLTLFGDKSAFRQEEIHVVGHLCRPYGRKPSPAKIDVIQAMEGVCESHSYHKKAL